MSDDVLEKIEQKIDSLKNELASLDKSTAILANTLTEHVKQDAKDLEAINSSLESIDQRLDEYNNQLQVHIQGVHEAHRHNNLLHEELKIVRKQTALQMDRIDIRLNRAETPIIVIKGLMWGIGALTAVLGLYALIKQLF